MAAVNMRKIRRLSRVVEMYDKQIEAKLQVKAELTQEKMRWEEKLRHLAEEEASEIRVLTQEMQASAALTYDYPALRKVFQMKEKVIIAEIEKINKAIAKILEEITDVYRKKQKLQHNIDEKLALKAKQDDKIQSELIDEMGNLTIFLNSIKNQ